MRRKIGKDLKSSFESFPVFALPLEFCLLDIVTLYLSKEDAGHVHAPDVGGACSPPRSSSSFQTLALYQPLPSPWFHHT